MCEIITVANQKGGVGKTTTTAALVSGLHRRGARVLGIDIDPQGNLGFSLGLEIGQNATLYDVLRGACDIKDSIRKTEYGNIIPADIMLSAAEYEFKSPQREHILAQVLEPLRVEYDFIIIDTPPSLNILTTNAFVASDSLIIPMEAEILSLVGLTQLQETIEAVRENLNPRLRVRGILFNKYNPRLALSHDVEEMVQEVARQVGTRIFPVKIRRGVDVARAPAHGQSVLTYAPNSRPAMDLQEFVDSIAAGYGFYTVYR